MPALEQDVDFAKSMHDLFGMDEADVEKLLDELDADELQNLTDAVAKQDRDAAQQIIGQSNTDEEVNSLFRGENLDDLEPRGRPRAARLGDDADELQFAIGDDVAVTLRDKHGKMRNKTATVSNPNGPEGTNTVVVSIKGKSTVVDKHNVHKLAENVIGMVGLPNILQRMQQLAGIQGGQGEMPQQIEVEPMANDEPTLVEPAPDDPFGQAMAALDTLEAALPNITLADAKGVRERLCALQVSMNEDFTVTGIPVTYGRARKR